MGFARIKKFIILTQAAVLILAIYLVNKVNGIQSGLNEFQLLDKKMCQRLWTLFIKWDHEELTGLACNKTREFKTSVLKQTPNVAWKVAISLRSEKGMFTIPTQDIFPS